MFAATTVLAVSTVALGLPASAGQGPSGGGPQSPPAWPHKEGRLFAMPSKEAWPLVQARLKELGVAAAKTDRDNQLLLTKWASFGDGRFEWLPRPTLSDQYDPERVRFEVFVSPFVEPARVYVGSLTELRRPIRGSVTRAILYNDRVLNQALLGELARALGQEGLEIPSSRKERDLLVASILKGRADDCPQRIDSCRGSGQLEDPRKLPISEFEVHYPQVAVEQRAQAPVVLELEVAEDGAVLAGRLVSAPRGHQLEAAAAGAASLLVYSPPRLCGCPVAHVLTFTVNYRLR